MFKEQCGYPAFIDLLLRHLFFSSVFTFYTNTYQSINSLVLLFWQNLLLAPRQTNKSQHHKFYQSASLFDPPGELDPDVAMLTELHVLAAVTQHPRLTLTIRSGQTHLISDLSAHGPEQLRHDGLAPLLHLGHADLLAHSLERPVTLSVTHQSHQWHSFSFLLLHLRLWVTSGHVQKPPRLCHPLAPPDQHHLSVTCAQDATHAQGLRQQRQGIVELRLSALTQLCHSARPVGAQVIPVAGEAQSQSEERPCVWARCVLIRGMSALLRWSCCLLGDSLDTFCLIYRLVSTVQTVLSVTLRISLMVHTDRAVRLLSGWLTAGCLFGSSTGWGATLRGGQAERVQSELCPVEEPRLFGHTLLPHLLYVAL